MKEKEQLSLEANQNIKNKTPKKPFFQKRSSWYLIGILLALMFVFVGVLIGVSRGINDRVALAEAQASPKIQSQIESAKLDIEEGRYQVALNRLDWVLEEMTDYLSEAELDEIGTLYSQALLYLSESENKAPTPKSSPTETANTPTPDLRGEEELFSTAQEYLAAEAWDEAILTLEALRNNNLEYKTVQVDGMLFVALRNRGVEKILVEGSLEPGIYDLTLAERFAPLDSTAEGFRTFARFYLTGASYWEVDWSQVVYYFEQVYQALPNLRDGTGMTATERFRIAAIEYAKQLAEAKEFCEAQRYMDLAMSLFSDPEIQPTQQWIVEKCYDIENPPKKEEPTEEAPLPTPTPSPTEGEEEPTPEPTTEEPPSGEPTPGGDGEG
jgi:tetratricopeptide (TPR) repeat protein